MSNLGPRQGVAGFLETDPFDFSRQFMMALFQAITFESATITIGTVPANSAVMRVTVLRTTAWDVVTTFEVGKTGDSDAYMTTAQSNVTAAAPGAETSVAGDVLVADTDIIVTLNQGAAVAGEGYVIVEFLEGVR